MNRKGTGILNDPVLWLILVAVAVGFGLVIAQQLGGFSLSLDTLIPSFNQTVALDEPEIIFRYSLADHSLEYRSGISYVALDDDKTVVINGKTFSGSLLRADFEDYFYETLILERSRSEPYSPSYVIDPLAKRAELFVPLSIRSPEHLFGEDSLDIPVLQATFVSVSESCNPSPNTVALTCVRGLLYSADPMGDTHNVDFMYASFDVDYDGTIFFLPRNEIVSQRVSSLTSDHVLLRDSALAWRNSIIGKNNLTVHFTTKGAVVQESLDVPVELLRDNYLVIRLG